MEAVQASYPEPCLVEGEREAFPPEVQFVLSALEAGPRPVVDRQKLRRIRHHVVARLSLFSDANGSEPRELYARHVNVQAMGFITSETVPLSHGGILEIADFDGRVIRIACTVLRCRPAAPGWYEGAVYFNRAQPAFAPPD